MQILCDMLDFVIIIFFLNLSNETLWDKTDSYAMMNLLL